MSEEIEKPLPVEQPRLVRLRPTWMKGDESNDWKEDSEHENGNYFNKCVTCECDFIGHKRRHVCKKCKLEDDARWQAMTEEERQSELAKMASALDAWLTSETNTQPSGR